MPAPGSEKNAALAALASAAEGGDPETLACAAADYRAAALVQEMRDALRLADKDFRHARLRRELARPGCAFAVRVDIGADPKFTRKFGQRVKAVGGRYSDVRGHCERRYVHLPACALPLADEIARTYRPDVVVVESGRFRELGLRASSGMKVFSRGQLAAIDYRPSAAAECFRRALLRKLEETK